MSNLITFAASGQWITSGDSGLTWTTLTSAGFPVGFAGPSYNGFRIFNDKSWLIVGDDGNTSHCVAFKSTNQGASWTVQGTTDTFGVSSLTAFLGDSVQIVYRGNNTKIVASTDGFITKTNVTLPGSLGVGAGAIGAFALTGSRFGTIWRDGGNDNHAMYSDNGITWTASGNGYPGNGTGGVNDGPGSFASFGGTVYGAMKLGVMSDGDGSGTYTIINSSGTHTGFDGIMSQPIPPFSGNLRLCAIFGDGAAGPFYSSIFNGTTWGALTLTNLGASFPVGLVTSAFYVSPDGLAFILIAANGGGAPAMFRSTDGVTWSNPTVPGGVNTIAYFMATPDTLIVPAPAERPHFIDRGLPIEIAGPRNDITRKAYLPNVRIFGA